MNHRKILYNLTPTQPSVETKFHGGGLYGEVVFHALAEFLPEGELIACYDDGRELSPFVKDLIMKHRIQTIRFSEYDIDGMISQHHITSYYSPGSERLPKESTKCRLIGTIHGPRELERYLDFSAIHYQSSVGSQVKTFIKWLFQKRIIASRWKPLYEELFKNLKYEIIAVSEHTKFSILNFFPFVAHERIAVYYSPLLDQVLPSSERPPPLPPNITKKKYFLIVGGNRWLKNGMRAITAIDNVFSTNKHSDYQCVVTGVANHEHFKSRIKNREQFIFLDYVDRDLLDTLHREAYAFIYPSLNEGFGYPPIDSMKSGVPVAVSGLSSIPEVCDNAALYFDPLSVSEISNRILQLLDPEIYAMYSSRCIKRYKEVSDRQRDDLAKLVRNICRVD